MNPPSTVTGDRVANPPHPGPHRLTTCSFCSYQFSEEEGEKACSRCAHFGGCKMVMCPRCGYEMPQTPKLIQMIQQWRLRRVGTTR